MDVQGYETLYAIYKDGRMWSHRSKRFLSTATCRGYRYVSLSKDGVDTKCLLHRLVATHFIPNPDKKPEVDHIDGNPLNCHKDNLRWATRSENCRNCSMKSTNTSGYKGVSWSKWNQKWTATMMYDGKKCHIGYFTTKEDARDAYRCYAEILYGDFNSPQ